MKKITHSVLYLALPLILAVAMVACEKPKEAENRILSFIIGNTTPISEGKIDDKTSVIQVLVPYQTDVTALVPTITLSEGATVVPASDVAQDFTQPVTYTVTSAEGKSKEYQVFVNVGLNPAKNITSFSFSGLSPVVNGFFNDTIITLTVPYSTNVTSLIATFRITGVYAKIGETIQNSGNTRNDFTNDVIYTVIAADGSTKKYVVKVVKAAASVENKITEFAFGVVSNYNTKIDTAKYVLAKLDHTLNTVTLNVPFGTDVSKLLPIIAVSKSATISPAPKVITNFSQNVSYTVTAENGTTRQYSVTVNVLPQETAVRGIWVTNVASAALSTAQNVIDMVALADELNINTLFVVVWNKAKTMYKSPVMKDLIGVEIDPVYGTRDPLQEVITEAHKRNIKVIAWFEYGFASTSGSAASDVILNAKPHWAAKDVNGNVVEKAGFRWMNSMLPEAQDFMLSLMLEVVNNYDVDGIQGDDRLPSMPTEAGYDDYTVNLYKTENGGASPPTSKTDAAWVQWRVNKMNLYQKKIFEEVKKADPNCVVSMAPHPFSWGRAEYCQDWRNWIKEGTVDMVHSQLYRYENAGIWNYKDLVLSELNAAKQNGDTQLDKFYPAALLSLGSYTPSNQYLADVFSYHREKGVKGECFFYFEGLKMHKELFKAVYPAEAIFPK